MDLTARVADILTYEGDRFDTALNYGTLVVVSLPFLWHVWHGRARSGEHRRLARWWALVLVYLWVFQIVLCIVEGECSGISVVWNAALAHGLYDERKSRVFSGGRGGRWASRLLDAAAVWCVVVNAYYAVVEEPITTVAHGCAAAMGFSISAAYWRFRRE